MSTISGATMSEKPVGLPALGTPSMVAPGGMIVACDACDYAANVEQAVARAPGAAPKAVEQCQKVSTPGQHSIAEVSAFLKQPAERLVKTLIYLVSGQPVAVLVYRRRQHVIDAYVRPARGPAGGEMHGLALTRDGFNIQSFARDSMEFWLVSDLNRNELNDLVRLLEQNPS